MKNKGWVRTEQNIRRRENYYNKYYVQHKTRLIVFLHKSKEFFSF